MTFALRPYQEQAIAAIESAWEDHDSVMVEMATGLGKTEVFTQLLKDCHSGSRGLVICPMLPLIHQAADKIQRRTGERPAIEQASNWSREHGWGRSDFVVGSKQSLTSKRRSGEKRFERFEDIGLLVVDECHLSITEPFAEMVNHFRAKGAKVIGLTATAKRHDKRAQGQLYSHCAFQYGIADAVKAGWLVDAKPEIITLTSLDLSNVGTQYGPNGADFAQGELCASLETMETICEIADVTARETRGLKTVVYCASVEEAKLVAERLVDHHGINAGWICADTKRCTTQRKENTLKSFTQDPNGITHVANVGILCLDRETEVLTDEGWVGMNDMTESHRVANWCQDSSVYFQQPKKVIRRKRLPGEKMVVAKGKRIDVRVTEGHEIIYRTGKSWRKRKAIDCVGKRFRFPVSGQMKALPFAWPEEEISTKRRRRLEVQNAWNLRTYNGMSKDESNVVAAERVEKKIQATRVVQPGSLSLPQCAFLGFWVGDGSVGKSTSGGSVVSASQSKTYPKIIQWFEETCEKAEIHFKRQEYDGHVTWSFAKGTGGGVQYRANGIARLMPYIQKDDFRWLWALSKEQFDVFLRGFWMADGDHGEGVKDESRAYRISNTNAALMETLHAVATLNGYRSNIVWTHKRNPKWSSIAMVSMKETPHYVLGNDIFEIDGEDWKAEDVWCVTVESGCIITRRNGKVCVMGNCTGWDFPGLQAIVQARPTKSLPLFTQIFGRGTRPLPGIVDFAGSTADLRRQRIAESDKPFFRMIDLVDNSLEHKIVTSADVLGGKYELETVQRAKEILADEDEDRNLSEVLDEAERRLKEEEEERRRAEAERKERERRARVQAQLEYDKRQVSAYGHREGSSRGRRQSGTRMPFGKHKGKLLPDIPLSYLQFADANWDMKPWLANSIRREIKYRTSPQPVSGGGADIDEINKLLRGF